MKFRLLGIALVLTIAVAAQNNAAMKDLVIVPEKPQPGSRIDIRYNAQNAALSAFDEIEATAYLLEGSFPIAVDIPLKKENGVCTGSFKTNDSTRAFFITFRPKVAMSSGEIDNNNDSGYYKAMYKAGGLEVMGANSALAKAFDSYFNMIGLSKSIEQAKVFNRREFASAAARSAFPKDYMKYLSVLGDEHSNKLLQKELEKMLARKNVTAEDMLLAVQLYESALQDKDKSDAVLSSYKKKFPTGTWIAEDFEKETDLQKKLAMFRQVQAANNTSTDGKRMINYMAFSIAEEYAKQKEYGQMESYASLIEEKSTRASLYMYIAAQLTGTLKAKPAELDKAIELTNKGLSLLREDMKSMEFKPVYLTPYQYFHRQNISYHNYLYTQGIQLFHQGQIDKAYSQIKQVVEFYQGRRLNMNEGLVFVAEKARGEADVQHLLEKFVADNQASPAMKEQLKTIYLKNHSPAEYETYLQQLELASFNRLKSKLAKTMTATEAADFSLKNLKGETVSLASLKGKIVILDFWSTWCGPCKVSFPSMQKAIDKYKNNPDIVFLFIDTWESADGREKKVSDFITENKYTFNVLYDVAKNNNESDYAVVQAYKVGGIPTKFIIDKKGRIRFTSRGWVGSTDGLLTELAAMIDIINSTGE